MSFPVWRLEWRVAVRRRRLLVLNLGIPLLLVLPIVLAGAPAYHAAAVYAVLFVLFGTFGSAIPLLREGDGGPLRRIVLAGASEPRLVLERVMAGAVLDYLQLLPAFLFIFAFGGAEFRTFVAAVPALAIGLLAANLIGVWVAATARSLAEGALFAAVVSLFILHGSGVFRTATPGTLAGWLEGTLPFGPLHRAFLAGAGGGTVPGPGNLFVPALVTLLLLLLTLAVAHRLLERITAAR